MPALKRNAFAASRDDISGKALVSRRETTFNVNLFKQMLFCESISGALKNIELSRKFSEVFAELRLEDDFARTQSPCKPESSLSHLPPLFINCW